MKIKEIIINNYRCFADENTISLGNEGKNLFLYGENGSGKSSFCKALNLFFDATDKRRTTSLINQNFKNSPFEKINHISQGSIGIHFTDNSKCRLDENGYSNESILEELNLIRRTKGFLEYKNLLPIYLYSDKKNNLFRLFIEGPFSSLRNPLTHKLISTEWNDRKRIKPLPNFYKGIFLLAESLEDQTNIILKYFDPTLTIKFKSRKTWTTGELYIEVFVNDVKLKNYGDYFNEAKLVALSISIYLSIILKQSSEIVKEKESESIPKLIVLDDVFIGMDLGNRIPLLKILNTLFDEYQIIITTFDENWYKLAEFYLQKGAWKFVKSYTNNHDPFSIKSELVDSDKEDYLNKAKFHFGRFDYPACANYQRKAIESKIKEILPDNLQSYPAEDGSIKRNDKLKTNYNNLIKYLDDCELDTQPFLDFMLYARVILNPLSHDNASSPIFKAEVESVFGFIDSLDNIMLEPLRIVHSDEVHILKLSVKDNADIWHQYKFELVDNLKRVRQGDRVGYAPCRVLLKAAKLAQDEWVEVTSQVPECIRRKYLSIMSEHNVAPTQFQDAFRNNSNIFIKDMKCI